MNPLHFQPGSNLKILTGRNMMQSKRQKVNSVYLNKKHLGLYLKQANIGITKAIENAYLG